MKKISADQVEVLDQSGRVVKDSDHTLDEKGARAQGFGNIRVIQGGPAFLLLAPLLIPLFIVGMILLMVFALFFGRSVFKVVTSRFPKRT